jgi:hypothetical protein
VTPYYLPPAQRRLVRKLLRWGARLAALSVQRHEDRERESRR